MNYALTAGNAHYGNPVSPTHRSTSWMIQVLPFVEQQPLYNMIDVNWDVRLDPRNGPTPTAPNSPSNLFAARTVIPGYLCPSDGLHDRGRLQNRANRTNPGNPPIAVQSYKGVCGANWQWGNFPTNTAPPAGSGLPDFRNTKWGLTGDGLDAGNGIFYRGGRADIGRESATPIAAVQDGTANTLMIGETVPRWCTHTWWYHFNGTTATVAVPLNVKAQLLMQGTQSCQTGNRIADLNCAQNDWPNNYSFFSLHPGGAQFCLGDGSVRFISDTIALVTYRSLGTMQNSESVALND
jgi:hypothetical protein